MGKRKGRRRCTSGEHKPLRVRLIVEEIDEVRAPVPGISRLGERRDGSRGGLALSVKKERFINGYLSRDAAGRSSSASGRC